MIYATLAQISSVKSLLGGVLPGILMSACLFIYVMIVDKKKLINPPSEKSQEKKQLYIKTIIYKSTPDYDSSSVSSYHDVNWRI